MTGLRERTTMGRVLVLVLTVAAVLTSCDGTSPAAPHEITRCTMRDSSGGVVPVDPALWALAERECLRRLGLR